MAYRVDSMVETALIWLDIPGYPGYQAGDNGQIRSVDRMVNYSASSRSQPYSMLRRGTVMQPHTRDSGHQQVCLGRDVNTDVHVLVCLAFHGPKPTSAHEVLHLNHNPADNRFDNLKWGTRSENLEMDYERGSRTGWAAGAAIAARWAKYYREHG